MAQDNRERMTDDKPVEVDRATRNGAIAVVLVIIALLFMVSAGLAGCFGQCGCFAWRTGGVPSSGDLPQTGASSSSDYLPDANGLTLSGTDAALDSPGTGR